jgi:hypothetical protein
MVVALVPVQMVEMAQQPCQEMADQIHLLLVAQMIGMAVAVVPEPVQPEPLVPISVAKAEQVELVVLEFQIIY